MRRDLDENSLYTVKLLSFTTGTALNLEPRAQHQLSMLSSWQYYDSALDGTGEGVGG